MPSRLLLDRRRVFHSNLSVTSQAFPSYEESPATERRPAGDEAEFPLIDAG